MNPPTNLRIERADGTVEPLEVVYEGVVDGIHQWRTTAPVALGADDRLCMDQLSERSAVVSGFYSEMKLRRRFRRWRYHRLLIAQGWDPDRARFAAIILASLDVHPSIVAGPVSNHWSTWGSE